MLKTKITVVHHVIKIKVVKKFLLCHEKYKSAIHSLHQKTKKLL